jgi:hypothetical protein
VVAVGLAIMLHELAHLVAGVLVGGSPALMTATELHGDFGSLSKGGFVLLGASGSVANALLMMAGFWVGSWREEHNALALAAWFMIAVNGMLLGTKMIGESVVGFGDWMTVASQSSAPGLLRVMLFIIGVALTIWMVRVSGRRLAKLLPSGKAEERAQAARRVVLNGALASAVLVIGAALPAPTEALPTMALALVAGLAPFIPMIFSARRVRRESTVRSVSTASGGWPLQLAAIACALVLWLGFGPGISV